MSVKWFLIPRNEIQVGRFYHGKRFCRYTK